MQPDIAIQVDSGVPRASAKVEADIKATAQRMRELQAEFVDARLAECSAIVRAFCDGQHPREIAKARGVTLATIQGILYRNGWTQKGRYRIAAKLDDNLRSKLRAAQ